MTWHRQRRKHSEAARLGYKRRRERCIRKLKGREGLNPYAICTTSIKEKNRRDETYKKYKKSTNMTASELRAWANNPCSKKASLSRSPIKRNLRLLSKQKSKWITKDYKDAQRTINYLNQSKGIKEGTNVKGCNLTKNEIARRNWARK